MSKKKKLTLSVSEDVIEKAKDRGLNISKVVEDTLEGFSFEPPEEISDSDLRELYNGLFKACASLMEQLNIPSLMVGHFVDRNVRENGKVDILPWDWNLWDDGTLHWEDNENPVSLEDISVSQFHRPKKIMDRLLSITLEKLEERKQLAREAKFVEDVVKSVSKYIADITESE